MRLFPSIRTFDWRANRFRARLVVAVLALFSGFALGGSAQVVPTRAQIAVVVATLASPECLRLAETAKTCSKALGHEAVVFDSQGDTAKEAVQFEDAIAAGFKVILFNPVDSKGSISSVRNARAAGVGVICFGRGLEATNFTAAQVLVDSYSAGVKLGEGWGGAVGRSGQYAEFAGQPGNQPAVQASRGFNSVVDRWAGLCRVVPPIGVTDPVAVAAATETILKEHPRIRGVFCADGSRIPAIQEGFVKSGMAGQVRFFGFGPVACLQNLVDSGISGMMAVNSPEKLGAKAADLAHQFLHGQRDFPPVVLVPLEVLTIEKSGANR